MEGQIWVESELDKGSRFMFTIMSRLTDYDRCDAVIAKMAPFATRNIMLVNSTGDNVDEVIRLIGELGLQPYPIRKVSEVTDKNKVPVIDTIIVDSLAVVSFRLFNTSPLPC